ncbi:glycosyltransferase family 2 protein [Oceanibium sediminis]|uniref:glycosyltransferase family 2 protein n=1 Tax=Oceanibium sediminis TaxID=2026339 RepID=UPI000DD2BAA0|nr:glycosyltransferase family 2 protein [Oceanibium sediminis]
MVDACKDRADFAEGALLLARAYRRERRNDAALAVLERALALRDPDVVGLRQYAEYADIQTSLQAFDDGLARTEEGLDMFPDNRALALRRIRIFGQSGRVDAALAALAEVCDGLELNPGDETFITQALRGLGKVGGLAPGQKVDLATLGERFIARYPEFPGLNAYIGDLARDRRDWATALSHYERALKVTRNVGMQASLRDRIEQSLRALRRTNPGAGAQETLAAPALRVTFQVAVITNVYNEKRNLPIWLGHYGRQIGIRNCIVLDHGSDDGSTDDLGGAGSMMLPRRPYYNERHRMALINQTANNLLNFYDAVIYTDCDEMLVADPYRYGSLLDYVRKLKRQVAHAIGFNLRHDPVTQPPLTMDRPILAQRPLAQFVSAMCKPLVIRRPVSRGGGFHSCEHAPVFDDLYLFRLRKADRNWAQERMETTREVKFEREGGGKHHRLSDEELQKSFDTVCKLKVSDGFDYEEDLKSHLSRISLSNSGRYTVKGPVQGRALVRIPERFWNVF